MTLEELKEIETRRKRAIELMNTLQKLMEVYDAINVSPLSKSLRYLQNKGTRGINKADCAENVLKLVAARLVTVHLGRDGDLMVVPKNFKRRVGL